MSQIKKILDEREMQNKQTNKQKRQRQKRTRGTEAIVKLQELNDFVVHLS